jgi:hypothetical protein
MTEPITIMLLLGTSFCVWVAKSRRMEMHKKQHAESLHGMEGGRPVDLNDRRAADAVKSSAPASIAPPPHGPA